jgi:hypothetical protein
MRPRTSLLSSLPKTITALTLTAAVLSPNARAELSPLLLQEFGQRIVDQVIQNDDMFKSAKGRFLVDRTRLEQNIAAVEVTATANNLPWAVGIDSQLRSEGSYQAVQKASRYGVVARVSVSGQTSVMDAIRYTATELNKDYSANDSLELEAKSILAQLEKVQTLSEVARLLRKLKEVSGKALAREIAEARLKVESASTNCARDALESAKGSETLSDAYFDRCVERKKDKLNMLEMAKIVQEQAQIEDQAGQSVTIKVTDAGGILQAAPIQDRTPIQKFENRSLLLELAAGSVTGTTEAFIGLRKHDFERIERKYKDALLKFQVQGPHQTKRYEEDLKEIVSTVKKFIRNSR